MDTIRLATASHAVVFVLASPTVGIESVGLL